MRMTRAEFLRWPHKAITLLGMSGVGKTTLAYKLPKSKWFHYSGDYRIGTKYLAEPILDNIKRQAMRSTFCGICCAAIRSTSRAISPCTTCSPSRRSSARSAARTWRACRSRSSRSAKSCTAKRRSARCATWPSSSARRRRSTATITSSMTRAVAFVELDDELHRARRWPTHTLILYLKADPELERDARAASDRRP